MLPPNVPVIATTATANQRVVEDIAEQLGNIDILRGPLVRESLVHAVEDSESGLKQYQILQKVNMRSGRLDKCIKFLEVENIIAKDKSGRYYRTPHYPVSMRSKLKRLAPPVLYYAGNLALLKNRGVSVVGSRNIDEAALRFTEKLAKRCTDDGMNIVSGGARGVDSVAESTAIRSDGTTIIVVADSMEKKIQSKETRNAIMRNQSLIFSAARPDMPFRTFAAMERNKYIYALADFVVVVSSDYNKGGTWAGAVENLRNNWVPMFVRKADDVPEGNIQLLKNKGVHALSEQVFSESMNLFDWFHNCSMSSNTAPEPVRQLSFFD